MSEVTTGICELSDTELDAVGAGSLIRGPIVSFSGPLVSFNNSFNITPQTNVQTGIVVFGGSLNQIAGNLGIVGNTFSLPAL
jgi:hypothetical protein